MVCFIGGVRQAGHLAVSCTVRIFTKDLVFKTIDMHDVLEWGEAELVRIQIW